MRWIKDVLFSVLAGILVPLALLNAFFLFKNYMINETAEPLSQFTVTLRNGTEINTIYLEDYVLGVVAGEMPLGFELEALKAQAIAARTYARKAALAVGKHADGSVCTNPACCQAYCTQTEIQERGNTLDEVNKLRRAVSETAGMVITYNGSLIEATYFSCSGGATEDAKEVWGSEYPYLISISSPDICGDSFAENVCFTREDLENLLDVTLSDNPENWFLNWKYTKGGGVESVIIGNRIFKGTQLRKILNLRSTLFSATIADNSIYFQTEGYGHRVGMSQYGADALALQGKTFREILQYYYPGTEIEVIEQF